MILNREMNYIETGGDFAYLQEIRSFVLDKATQFGFEDSDAHRISLAVDEACSNLIRHSYKSDIAQSIRIEIDRVADQFTVNIFDHGVPFNPTQFPAQDMQEYFKQFKSGGLGIQIMRLVMDSIRYTPASKLQKYNILTLVKNLK